MPSSVLPPARDARRRMFDPAAVGATLGACSVQLGCFATVRRVRRQAVSRAGARKVRGAERHAGSPSTPAVSACTIAVRSGRSDPCSRIGNRWRLHAGRTDAQGTVQRAGRLHLVDGVGVNRRSLCSAGVRGTSCETRPSGTRAFRFGSNGWGCAAESILLNGHRKTDNREVCTLQESDVSRPETIPRAGDAKIGLIVG